MFYLTALERKVLIVAAAIILLGGLIRFIPASYALVSPAKPLVSGKIVNINTASYEQLQTLPGIGPSFAQKIIDFRQQNNGFKQIQDLTKIKGIGPKKFKVLEPRIILEDKPNG